MRLLTGDYERYVRNEWTRFLEDPARMRSSREAVSGLKVARVLDVGCGAGQELLPFVDGAGVLGVGLDSAQDVGLNASGLLSHVADGSHVTVVRGVAERLPFRTGCFDVVTCRLLLPYSDNADTLTEIGRVLRNGGVLLLKYHDVRYYLRRAAVGITNRQWYVARHALLAILSGAIYHITRRQCRHRLLKECFQTGWFVRRLLDRNGLVIRRKMPDWNPLTPSYLITRDERKAS